jgi:hypothetical protein
MADMVCAWCLNLANNAGLPAVVEWETEGGMRQKTVTGAEQLAHEIRAHYGTVGFKIRAYQLEITDPMAVTMVGGTACCGVHAGWSGWPPAPSPYPLTGGRYGR